MTVDCLYANCGLGLKMKFDLVMWTKNGEKLLSSVLDRIDSVIPYECVNQKILVDDHSNDRTVEIARDFNWTVYENPSTGISAGANEALRRVKSPLFISF
jgi:glycosyltransferase involved in cell wall biosynthesis